MEFLLRIAEDRSVQVARRRSSLFYLGLYGHRGILRRLEALASDDTPVDVPGPGEPIGIAPRVLGAYAKAASELVRTRAEKR